jgi:hypothetical protein
MICSTTSNNPLSCPSADSPPRSRIMSRKRSWSHRFCDSSTSEHQVVFAGEVLVEGSAADADVGQDLIDPDVAEPIPVEPLLGGGNQSLARG